MNSNFISRALCFHGQPMQKIWEDERGANDLQQCGVPVQTDYTIYLERQKYFTFQDRAKRLKLHQFFARKANDLYDKELSSETIETEKLAELQPFIAKLPPYELFVNKNQDKYKRWHCILEGIKPGDIIYGVITKVNPQHNIPSLVKPLCTAEPQVRYLSDITVKAYLQLPGTSKTPLDKRNNPRNFETRDFVCCEVLEISVDADRLYLGVDGVVTKRKDVKLGLVTPEQLPEYFRRVNEHSPERYEDYLQKSKEFLNPNYDMLYEINGINVNDTFTLMSSLKIPFPRSDYAKELRRTQASKWAFRSVAEGIEHFKNGQHVEAFQCLNKALSIDPRNVEGLVARGALYANKGSFLKAVDDFEKALKLNSYHVNARKYMGETLVALGRRYEEESRIQEATKAYKDCLNIIPNHEQARLSLEAIQQRTGGSLYFDNHFSISGTNDETDKFAREGESSSEDSSSDDSGSSAESEHLDDDGSRREQSLSPLSKRMALHAASLERHETQSQQFNQPFYMTAGETAARPAPTKNPNEFRLDDDDTESRVRKLLHEASKHKKEKKKSKKKKSKKSKKSNQKEKNATTLLNKINFQEAYKAISSLNIENKLNENLQIYEKTIAEIRKRQEILDQSTSNLSNSNMEPIRQRMETPPPKAPSMRMPSEHSTYSASAYPIYPSTSAAAASKTEPAKLSFQIKRPVKVDKFGLVRIATPLAQESPLRSRSRSKSRNRYPSGRGRSSSRDRYRNRRTRSRSSSRGRRGGRRLPERRRSRSFSPRRGRSRSLSRSRHSDRRRSPPPRRGERGGLAGAGGRRRTPSPFVPRDTPPRRRSRTPTNDKRERERMQTQYGHRVWRRNEMSSGIGNGAASKSSDGRWLHDKFKEDEAVKIDDGPSIEEIDEIINRAQRERKQEIISRDKNILKRSNFGI